jgi:hypothetical protein
MLSAFAIRAAVYMARIKGEHSITISSNLTPDLSTHDLIKSAVS